MPTDAPSNYFVTVAQLRELIKDVPDDYVVILQKDAEGNGYSPLAGVDDTAAYTPETTWAGEVAYREITDQIRKEGYSDEDKAGPGAVPCLVLYPIN